MRGFGQRVFGVLFLGELDMSESSRLAERTSALLRDWIVDDVDPADVSESTEVVEEPS